MNSGVTVVHVPLLRMAYRPTSAQLLPEWDWRMYSSQNLQYILALTTSTRCVNSYLQCVMLFESSLHRQLECASDQLFLGASRDLGKVCRV
jgi:hypothetical protein